MNVVWNLKSSGCRQLNPRSKEHAFRQKKKHKKKVAIFPPLVEFPCFLQIAMFFFFNPLNSITYFYSDFFLILFHYF